MPREGTLRRTRTSDGPLGLAFSAFVGLAAGVAAGLVLGGMAGDLNRDRLRGAVRRLGGRRAEPEARDPDELAREVRAALRAAPRTRHATVQVEAVGPGLLELTGTAADVETRHAVGQLVRDYPGVVVVVNRVLVPGTDLPLRDAPDPPA